MSYTHRVDEGQHVRLADYDPDSHAGLDKDDGVAETAKLAAELGELQDLLFAAGQHALLIVLQARDTGGKDGLIRHLVGTMNAQSCRIVPFKEPTPEETAHDFLWRVHAQTPARGTTAIFNRSHYEDVLVVRVHALVAEPVWQRRYDHINHFERLLADEGTIVLKFYLHISREEQKQRLLARERDPAKAWKLSVGDWKERELWDRYTEAYEDALSRCSQGHAPWFVVPADHKWFRDLAVTERIVETLRPYREGWMKHLEQTGAAARQEIDAYRQQHPD